MLKVDIIHFMQHFDQNTRFEIPCIITVKSIVLIPCILIEMLHKIDTIHF